MDIFSISNPDFSSEVINKAFGGNHGQSSIINETNVCKEKV